MTEKIAHLWPEIILFITLSINLILGLSPDKDFRRSNAWITGLGLFFALIASLASPDADTLLPGLAGFIKPVVCIIGLMLLVGFGSVDRLYERDIDRGAQFDPLQTAQGETLAFFLLSLIGVMLCATAGDLIWLFLALELTSLPTYIMVATARRSRQAQEAGVKYFYLGALAAAVFLYGFALLYGATGSLHLADIRLAFVAGGEWSTLAILGLLLSVLGIAYKIAAFPMHFYTADVYEGAATPVSAFLAFVPKAAGFIAIMLLLSAAAGMPALVEPTIVPPEYPPTWPTPVHDTLWIVAVLTMTVGNTLALWQRNIKRILAYSSIAHSGYMLIGVIAGPVALADAILTPAANGYAAVLFYLLAYGVMNLGAFLVLACLRRGAREIETLDDLAGIGASHPWLSTAMSLCALSLLGLPPLIGFFGKLYLFAVGIAAGEYALVIIAGLNSAIAAWYYLKLAGLPWLASPAPDAPPAEHVPSIGRPIAVALSAVGVVVLTLIASPLLRAGHRATLPAEAESIQTAQAPIRP